jgi:hypothetical protein
MRFLRRVHEWAADRNWVQYPRGIDRPGHTVDGAFKYGVLIWLLGAIWLSSPFWIAIAVLVVLLFG